MSKRYVSKRVLYVENIRRTADRVTTFVTNHLFRLVSKFISNNDMFAKAIKEVMDNECVANRDRVKFQILYESILTML